MRGGTLAPPVLRDAWSSDVQPDRRHVQGTRTLVLWIQAAHTASERPEPDRASGQQSRAIATSLNNLATAMKSYRDLPAAPHDESVLGDTKSRDVFAAFIEAEENALTLLQEQTREYRAMLAIMDAGEAE